MPPPLRRKRCSFGGKEGVWWRRKATSAVVPTRPTPHSQPVMTTTNNDKEPVGLDKVLVRPPVHQPTSCRNHSSSSSSEESGDHNPSSFVYEWERPQQRLQTSSTHLPKRRKTFGGLSRRPLSLVLSNESNLFSSLISTEQEASVARRPSPNPEVNLGPGPGGQTTSIPLPSPLPRDKDMESLRGAPPNAKVSPFRFQNDNEPLNRWDTPQRPTATSSIQQARDYFAYLDSAHHLQIDSSFSPSPRRRITRTTRKVQLSSPSFVNEYTKYARASRELGVTPLATREYAKSRRQFFRKAELFDGFVDS